MKKFFSFISKFSKRERIIFNFTVFLIFIVIVSKLIISPIVLKIRSLDKEIAEKNKAIEKSLLILSRKSEVEKESKKYNVYLEKFSIKEEKSREEKMLSFLKNVEVLAENCGIKISASRPIGSVKEAQFQKEILSLDCEAELKNLLVFFYKIESSEDLLKIERFRIVPSGKKSEFVKCSIEISEVMGIEEE